MLQISDRTDFTTKLAYFMTAQQNLVRSGIDPTGEALQASTDKFLDQFTIPAQQPAPVTQIKALAGYILKDTRTDKVANVFNRSLFRSEEQARAELEKYITNSHHHLYQIVPVYL